MVGNSRRYHEAIRRLVVATANDTAAQSAARRTRAKRNELMIKAVEAGATRYEVAKITSMSPQNISKMPGMPAKSSPSSAPDRA